LCPSAPILFKEKRQFCQKYYIFTLRRVPLSQYRCARDHCPSRAMYELLDRMQRFTRGNDVVNYRDALTFHVVGILFVEDIHEHPYRIERMLLHLYHAGILGAQRALVLGHFSEFTLTGYDNGYDFGAMLDWIRSHLPIPVITGLPFGHIRDKVTLPVGARGHLVSGGGRVRLDVEGYPTLAGPGA